MPPRVRKRKSETEGEAAGNSNSTPAATRGNKKQAVGKKPPKPLEEYIADEGRNGARSFLESVSTAKKRRSNAANAKKEVRKKADEVLAQIEESDNTAFHGLHMRALQKLQEGHAPSVNVTKDNLLSKAMPSSNLGISDKSRLILQKCLESAAAYRSAIKRDTGSKQPDWMRWSKDTRDLRSLNKHALELAVKVVEQGILGAVTGKSTQLQMPRKSGDLERLAWEMLDEVMPRAGEATWGTVANAQLYAMIGLGKALGTDGVPTLRT